VAQAESLPLEPVCAEGAAQGARMTGGYLPDEQHEGIEIGSRLICHVCHGLGFRRVKFWIFSWKVKCPKAFTVTAINATLQEE
jgi:hypothetical protein